MVQRFCATLPDFVAIGQSVNEISRFFSFQHGGGPPCWIFLIEILTADRVKSVNLPHHTKFYVDR